MKRFNSPILLLFACSLLSLGACEKLELPTPEEATNSSPAQPNTPTSPSASDPSTPDNPPMDSPTDTTTTNPNEEAPTTPEEGQTLSDTLQYVATHGISEDHPFRVSDFKTYIPVYLHYYQANGMRENYVRGYIVGYIDGRSLSATSFSATQAVESNIVMANLPDETDPNACIAIQLTTSSSNSKATREALNLAAHPENLGREVVVYGNVATYMGAFGMKNARWYDWME